MQYVWQKYCNILLQLFFCHYDFSHMAFWRKQEAMFFYFLSTVIKQPSTSLGLFLWVSVCKIPSE